MECFIPRSSLHQVYLRVPCKRARPRIERSRLLGSATLNERLWAAINGKQL